MCSAFLRKSFVVFIVAQLFVLRILRHCVLNVQLRYLHNLHYLLSWTSLSLHHNFQYCFYSHLKHWSLGHYLSVSSKYIFCVRIGYEVKLDWILLVWLFVFLTKGGISHMLTWYTECGFFVFSQLSTRHWKSRFSQGYNQCVPIAARPSGWRRRRICK